MVSDFASQSLLSVGVCLDLYGLVLIGPLDPIHISGHQSRMV